MPSVCALLGLAGASMATALAVREPPQGIDKTSYLLAVSGVFFFSGVNLVAASVSATSGAGRKLVYAAPLVVAAAAAGGLALASLLL